MQQLAPWLFLFALIAAIEGTVRFGFTFDLRRVLIVEAVLLFASAIASGLLIRRTPHVTGWPNGLRWGLLVAFLLGAVRAALWASGLPVMWSNLTIAILGAVSLVTVAVLRRRRMLASRGAHNAAA